LDRICRIAQDLQTLLKYSLKTPMRYYKEILSILKNPVNPVQKVFHPPLFAGPPFSGEGDCPGKPPG
jgi:hypothetical protein